MDNPHAEQEDPYSLTLLQTSFWQFHLHWFQMTFGLHQTHWGWSPQYGQHKYNIDVFWDLTGHTRFSVWLPVTSNDIWSTPKRIGIIYSMWPTHTSSIRSLKDTVSPLSYCISIMFSINVSYRHMHTSTHTQTTSPSYRFPPSSAREKKKQLSSSKTIPELR